MIVVDTNILAYFTIPGSESSIVEALLGRDPEWAAPLLWRSEFRNLLSTYVRIRKFDIEHAMAVMELARNTIATREFIPETREVLHLAQRSGRSAYDCEFVAIALNLGTHLITADKRLHQSFPEIAIHPNEFAG